MQSGHFKSSFESVRTQYLLT